jgi:two-component system, NtrC family, sensor kinase
MTTNRFSLSFAILASLSCLLILTWLLLSLISFKTSEKDLLSQKSEQGRLLLAAFIHLLPAEFSVTGSVGSADRFVGRIATENIFQGLLVIDRHGRQVYGRAVRTGIDGRLQETVRTGVESAVLAETGLSLVRYAPIREDDTVVGAVRLTLSLVPEYEQLSRSRHLFVAYFLLDFFLLLVFGSYLLSRCIVRPIKRLLTVTNRITAGDLSVRVPVPGSTELAELAEAFNVMVDDLRQKKAEVDEHIGSLERINRDLQLSREETFRSEKMASVGLLAAGTAHEIGTPLAAIIGFAGILREELHDNAEQADYLSRIEEEAGRIDRIMRGLLDYARPTAAERELIYIGELVSSTMEMLTTQGVFKDIVTSLTCAMDEVCLYCDRHELQQAFINLFINARDAMPQGGSLDVRIFIRESLAPAVADSAEASVHGRRRTDFGGIFHAERTPCTMQTALCVEVRDSGMGIDPELLERVFDPFFTTKEPGKGTGLGLAVTARIVDALGGRITVVSTPERGSCFTVCLPYGHDSHGIASAPSLADATAQEKGGRGV